MSAATDPIRPFIGLRYFEERDAHLFYGRDDHVSELLAKIALNRFVAVMGSSGCGKSSLVRAGLLPELRSGMIPKAGPRWKVVEFRPGRAPLQELASAISSALHVERSQQLVEEGPLGIARAVAEAKLDEGTNVLVIADQFEEVFRFQREEADQGRGTEAAEQCQALTRRLLDAAAQPELPIYVLLVMRSDYLGECAQFPDLPERMSGSLYLVPRLRRDQLQEAITAPMGSAIEPAVVQRLLGEVGSDPDQLPRLQHLLGRMWDRAGGGRLTMRHYTDAGGWIKGLEQHLDEVFTNLDESQQTICERLFQQLSELDKGRAVRRRAEIAELTKVCRDDVTSVVAKFRAEGFLSLQESPVDITHECVLREWSRLRDWLDREDFNARRLRELAEAAQDAGWQLELAPAKKKTIRELAGLTLQNLRVWCDEAQPTATWARRYLAEANFEIAYSYLIWSEERETDRKRYELWRTRLLPVLMVLLVLGFAVSLMSYRWSRRAEDSAAEAARQKEVAEGNAERASAEKRLAQKSAGDAADEKAIASANEEEARRQEKIAENQTASAQRSARESSSGELAAFATESLADDPEKGILLGMHAVNATRQFGQGPLPASLESLHQAILSSLVRKSLKGHTSIVTSVAWSPDGKRLATASWDQTARVWDASSGQELLTLKGHTNPVTSVAWSPDGKHIATASEDQTAKVWDASSGQELLTLNGHTDTVDSVAWSPDGKRLATASVDQTARVWDALSGQELHTLRGHTETVKSVAWSPDGKHLATASVDQVVKVWDASSGQEFLLLKGHTDTVTSVTWSPDGRRLATASDDQTVKVWDWKSGHELLTLYGHSGAVTSVAWSLDGKCLATAGVDQTAKVWDASSGHELVTLKGRIGYLSSVTWSPDGKRLATASWDQTVKIWDVASRQELFTLNGHSDTVTSVTWSPDGKRLATASLDQTARVWDAASGQALFALKGHPGYLASMAWSPDGKRLATASVDQTAKVWDAASGQELFTLKGRTGNLTSVAWSPDGKRLATASADQTAKVWDALTGQELLTLNGHTKTVDSVAWSPDGKRLATASEDQTAKVWDASNGQELLTLKGHTSPVTSVAWSPDGKRLATASWDQTAKVWDASSGQELLTLNGHTDTVVSVAWSPDGKHLATASEDQTAKVWDALSGHELVTLRGHTDTVDSVAWSPDSKRLATASIDRTVQIYAMDTSELLGLARSRVTRNLTPNECQRYFQSATCPSLP
jgi:WD40 repeat protein/energy-coupling factor transporter ATP-binding protein EcfA2